MSLKKTYWIFRTAGEIEFLLSQLALEKKNISSQPLDYYNSVQLHH